MERKRLRFLDCRKRRSLNWYWSMKRYDGRVRYVCSLHVEAGAVKFCAGKVRVRVGWRPVGWLKLVV